MPGFSQAGVASDFLSGVVSGGRAVSSGKGSSGVPSSSMNTSSPSLHRCGRYISWLGLYVSLEITPGGNISANAFTSRT